MKSLLLLTFVLLFSFLSIAQGTNCGNADPFCTGNLYTFPAGVNNGSAEAGNSYGCLGTQPNPAWYYLEIDQPGNMTIQMTNSNGVDIDFILYGPYNDHAQAMSNCGNMGAAGSGAGLNGIVDCSYSTAATENADITGAQTGDVYVLLITNFSNTNTDISFTNTAGTATTDCSIVEPCSITSLNVTVGACDPGTGLFNVTGTVDIVDPPATGSLIAIDCNGNQTTVANAPFGSPPYNFAINGITADGAACGVDVYFSDEPTCEASVIYNNPPPCSGCSVTAGNSGPICDGANLTVDLTATNIPGATYSWTGPGGFTSSDENPIGAAVPSGAGTYDFTVEVDDNGAICTDVTTVTVYALPVVDAGTYSACEDAGTITLAGSPVGGTFSGTGITGNDFDVSSGTQTVTYQYTDGNGCTNTDDATITVNPLPVVDAGNNQSICDGDGVITLTGNPVGGTFSGTGITGNDFDPAVGTQIITYDYTDGNSCSNSDQLTITVNETPVADAGNDYSFCASGVAQIGTPEVPGMNYSWSPVTDLNDPNIGQPTATIAGVGSTTYTVTVTNALNPACMDTDDVTVTISPEPTLNITNDLTICPGDCANLSISGADYYQWAASPDILDPTLVDQTVCPAATTTYDVTGFLVGSSVISNGDFSAGATGFTSDYTLNANTQTEGTYFVTTNANLTHPGFTGVDHTTGAGNFLIVNGSQTPNSSVWCQTIQIQPNTDYIFSSWVSTLAVGSPAELQFSINGINLSTPFTAPAGTGIWDEFFTTWNSGASTSATICIVNQNVAGGGNDFGIDDINFAPICSSMESVTVTVNPLPVVDAGADETVCEGSSVITLAGSPAGGTFSGIGMTGNDFDPAAGTQTITYDYTDANGCSNSDQVTITVEPTPVVDAGNYGPVCENAADVALVGSPAGGTFSGTGVSGSSFDPSNGTQTITYDYTSAAGCSNTANTVITVNPLPVVDAGTYSDVCIDAANVALVGNPVGGVFSGTGVAGNQFSPASGTQTVSYTYTDGNGCTNVDNATITVNDLPVIDAGGDQTICEGDEISLNGSGGVSYVWSNGVPDGAPFTPSLGVTNYTVTGTDANGCTNTDMVSVTTVVVPTADVTASIETGLPSLVVDFYNNSVLANTYYWNFGDGTTGTTVNLNTQTNTFDEPGTYWVVLTATNGICSDYDTVQIVVMEFPAPILNIPNVFTPNGDNSNDVFFIDAQNVVSIEYIIVNRWNNLMFQGNGINPVWDGTAPSGTPAEDGVYFVKYEIVGLNGDVLSGHGHVTLVR